jgi:hypothetical protein
MFRRLPPQGADQRGVAEIVNNIMDGKTNNTGFFELDTGSMPLTVDDARCGGDSVILLSPTNSRACQLINHVFISSVSKSAFELGLRSGSSGSGTATFSYVIVG